MKRLRQTLCFCLSPLVGAVWAVALYQMNKVTSLNGFLDGNWGLMFGLAILPMCIAVLAILIWYQPYVVRYCLATAYTAGFLFLFLLSNFDSIRPGALFFFVLFSRMVISFLTGMFVVPVLASLFTRWILVSREQSPQCRPRLGIVALFELTAIAAAFLSYLHLDFGFGFWLSTEITGYDVIITGVGLATSIFLTPLLLYLLRPASLGARHCVVTVMVSIVAGATLNSLLQVLDAGFDAALSDARGLAVTSVAASMVFLLSVGLQVPVLRWTGWRTIHFTEVAVEAD